MNSGFLLDQFHLGRGGLSFYHSVLWGQKCVLLWNTQALKVQRNGGSHYPERTFVFSYSKRLDGRGLVAGFLCLLSLSPSK